MSSSLRQLAAESKELDREGAIRAFRPLTATERKAWERVKAKPGRPKIGQGAKRVLVTIEGGLLAAIDRVARSEHKTRAAIVKEGLELVLGRRRPV